MISSVAMDSLASQSASQSLTSTRVEPDAPSDFLRTMLLVMPIVAAVILAKFAVPPFGERGIGLTLPIVFGLTAMGCILGRFNFSPARLALFTIMLALLGMPQFLRTDQFYLQSMLLLAALHAPYVLQLRGDAQQLQRDRDTAFSAFQVIAAICAVGAIAQFSLQFVLPREWVFPIENLMPLEFTVRNYNPEAALSYGSTIYRANGIFLMEPSYLSQLLAISIMMELCTRNRWWHMLLSAVAILVSYSGTGLMILALCVPLFIISKRRWDLMLAIGVLIAIALIFSQQLHLDSLLSRSGEYKSTGSSGFARFVGGFYMFDQFMWGDNLRTLFGFGAGSFKDFVNIAHYPVAEMPLFKMIFEFGVVGASLYFFFLGFCMWSSGVPPLIALAVGLTYLLNGLYVPFSHALALSLLIWTSHRPPRISPRALPLNRAEPA